MSKRLILGSAVTILLAANAWLYFSNKSIIESQELQEAQAEQRKTIPYEAPKGKPVVYQVFTRLFGNQNTANKPWGSIRENGVGKFADFTPQALAGIRELGVTHLWYTGVPRHALVGDYRRYGIPLDDPDVVKGRAGSPYAVIDYYDVNPVMAINPAKRMAEFKELVDRTHQAGMKVIIDIVPNHVARGYKSLAKPQGIQDFGVDDDKSVTYKRDNNFYYIPNKNFKVPTAKNDYKPIGGEAHIMADGQFQESPAKWTGNGSRKAQPDFNDWYETVKVNYGVRPDGSYDFPRLPADYAEKDYKAHAQFWADKSVPDSWKKFRDIALYWTGFGIDGFRYDMAEMVPVEFWSYLNSHIKMKNPDAFILAEVYQPPLYRDFIQLGKMDYLYDKVDLYDTLKAIMQGKAGTDKIDPIIKRFTDIDQHLLHFLENHDEQRIASPDFAGNAEAGKPAMVVSALISKSPTLLYFGQEVGEDGSENAGFGSPTRTSIFDYVGVPAHQRWMNGGKFDGGALTAKEKDLRAFYSRLMMLSKDAPALQGQYAALYPNKQTTVPHEQLIAFMRWSDNQRLLIASNFSRDQILVRTIKIPQTLLQALNINLSTIKMKDILNKAPKQHISVNSDTNEIVITLAPLESIVLEINS